MRNEESPSRRNFLKYAATTGIAVAATRSGFAGVSEKESSAKSGPVGSVPVEWRNKMEGMSYRQLGKTGFMVSEVVMGAFAEGRLDVAREAVERGLNYFDTAERYGNGKCEEAIGLLLKEAGMRDRIYITTKISSYKQTLDRWANEVLEGLPSEKQEATRRRARERIEELGIMKPGYHFNYFPNHESEIPRGYLTNQIWADYGHRDGFEKRLRRSLDGALEGCLKRLDTNYVDVLMAPHGLRHTDEMDQPTLVEFFEAAKKAGKIRATGFSVHSDVPELLVKASESGIYDVAMFAYNIVNQGSMEVAVRKASENGLGLIAMKAARVLNRKIDGEDPPQWRIDKMNTAVPGNERLEVKAYKWALQNPRLTAVISGMQSVEMVKENLAVAGTKVDMGLI